jgi:flagellar protein FliT
MTNHEQVLASYDTAAEITGQMLAAARASDWKRLSALETLCAEEIRRLRLRDPVNALSPTERHRKIDVITRILANDREIRIITEPWMARLSALLGGASVEGKLSGAYRDAHVG